MPDGIVDDRSRSAERGGRTGDHAIRSDRERVGRRALRSPAPLPLEGQATAAAGPSADLSNAALENAGAGVSYVDNKKHVDESFGDVAPKLCGTLAGHARGLSSRINQLQRTNARRQKFTKDLDTLKNGNSPPGYHAYNAAFECSSASGQEYTHNDAGIS